MPGVIFLTGATGFLGTQILHQLVKDNNNEIIALVRAKSKDEAIKRASRIWWDWPELRNLIGTRITLLNGDILHPQLGLNDDEYIKLVQTVSHVIHTAADLKLDAPVDELRKTNVTGTANILRLAGAINSDHGLSRLSHVSTAYVAGGKEGIISENSLSNEYGFNSNYELSKFEGEQLVQAARSELPATVFRPGMIVGDSTTGAIKTFNTVYVPIRWYLNRKLRIIPSSRFMKVNIVPVDYVAEAVARLTFEPKAEGLNFHLIAPWEKLPDVGELLEFVRNWAKDNLGEQLPSVRCVPLLSSVYRDFLKTLKFIQPAHRGVFRHLDTLAPYFNEVHQFSRENTDRLLGAYSFNWQGVLKSMLEYAVSQNFLNRSSRTVHEQILFRLRSKSLPVTYHDITNGKIIDRDTEQVRNEMLQAATALQRMGIGRSDRVALAGLNNSRYLTIDVAIGLVGAVSVPIYYTTPPEEIDTILKDCGAKIFFVGTPKILERLDELQSQVTIVNYYRQDSVGAVNHEVINWKKFLEQGENSQEVPVDSPAGFNSLATIRYTSGTLGEPKGACFDYENLRWMAEATAALMPWKARNSRVSYISHLPLNHVVEGMLATYSQYYIPAPVDIYFLEDLHELSKVMSDVRPTVFFSVPRFYEKLWEALTAARLGKTYAGSKSGSLKKRALRIFLRPMFLKISGLDKCRYFLAGSAPSNEKIMHNLQELGIDVHNAYGLTEAPLVTMNRLGANQIGTAGAPLPNTELAFADDGEIMVRGPQVMRCYLGTKVNQPFIHDWLKTGDIGHLAENGNLVIDGRKKEILKTSYGKYLHPGKIEALLKEISHVDEAMVVGDGKPYCIAILWVKNVDNGLVNFLEQQILRINTRLSHPEQIKRWAILRNNLSIGNGLTANLKLKRTQSLSNLSEVISSIYEGKSCKGQDLISIGNYNEEGR